jgi:hypothetical protein
MPWYGSSYTPGYSGYFPLGSSSANIPGPGTSPSLPEYGNEYYSPGVGNYTMPGYNGYFYYPGPTSSTYTPSYSGSAGQGYFYQ